MAAQAVHHVQMVLSEAVQHVHRPIHVTQWNYTCTQSENDAHRVWYLRMRPVLQANQHHAQARVTIYQERRVLIML